MSKSYIMQVGVSLMAEYVTQMKSRITIIVGVSAKIRNNIMCAKKIIFGILLHVVAKMVNI